QRPLVKRAKLFFKRFRRIGPMVRSAYWGMRWRKAGPILDGVRRLNATSDILLLEASTVKMGKLPQFVDGLQRKNGHHRLEMHELPGGSTRGFHSLDRQAFVIRRTIEWLDQTFPGTSPRPSGEPRSLGQAARI